MAALAAATVLQAASAAAGPHDWTDADKAVLKSLWIGSLGELPADPTNAHADDAAAADLGHRLFFDSRLSADGSVACATCHRPDRRFTDGLAKARGIGVARRNTQSIVGSAYSPWFFWDGRRDSLWSQALVPLEDPAEHGTDRRQVAKLVAEHAEYRRAYEAVFGPLPNPLTDEAIDGVFANAGKAIEAYERLLVPGASRFDAYVEAVLDGDVAEGSRLFSADEAEGLRLFLGEAQCLRCHNGPLLTNNEFHNTGLLSAPGEVPDKGRVEGVRQLRATPFNCRGQYSDADEAACTELEFVADGAQLLGAMRTPSLRNLEGTEPYMHHGQLATLTEVLRHYNEAPLAMIGHSEAEPLGLSGRELRRLEAFLQTLSAPVAAEAKWLAPPLPAEGKAR